MNVKFNHRYSTKNIRTKIIFGPPNKKGFKPLPLSSIKGKEAEKWSDKNKESIISVDQFLEGLDKMKIIHEYHSKE